MPKRTQLSADDVGGKAGAEEAAVERGRLFFVERPAAEAPQLALDAGFYERGFVRFGENGGERGFDVAVRNAADAEFAGDAKFSLMAILRMSAGEVAGVAGIVEIIQFAQFLQDGVGVVFFFGAQSEIFLHLVHGMCAAHQCASGRGVKAGLGGEFARSGAHEERILVTSGEC